MRASLHAGATHDDSWCNPQLSRKREHARLTEPLSLCWPAKLFEGRAWDQEVGSESIRLVFLHRCVCSPFFDEDETLSMQEDVARLVKKGEPKMIVRLVAEAELN